VARGGRWEDAGRTPGIVARLSESSGAEFCIPTKPQYDLESRATMKGHNWTREDDLREADHESTKDGQRENKKIQKPRFLPPVTAAR
jgi:hypothetical protein